MKRAVTDPMPQGQVRGFWARKSRAIRAGAKRAYLRVQTPSTSYSLSDKEIRF